VPLAVVEGDRVHIEAIGLRDGEACRRIEAAA
jgi:hypothetical protein